MQFAQVRLVAYNSALNFLGTKISDTHEILKLYIIELEDLIQKLFSWNDLGKISKNH